MPNEERKQEQPGSKQWRTTSRAQDFCQMTHKSLQRSEFSGINQCASSST